MSELDDARAELIRLTEDAELKQSRQRAICDQILALRGECNALHDQLVREADRLWAARTRYIDLYDCDLSNRSERAFGACYSDFESNLKGAGERCKS